MSDKAALSSDAPRPRPGALDLIPSGEGTVGPSCCSLARFSHAGDQQQHAVGRAVPDECAREPQGSIVDAAEDDVRPLQAGCPTMAVMVIAGRIAWSRGLSVLRKRVRECGWWIRNSTQHTRTKYAPGEVGAAVHRVPAVRKHSIRSGAAIAAAVRRRRRDRSIQSAREGEVRRAERCGVDRRSPSAAVRLSGSARSAAVGCAGSSSPQDSSGPQ